jgi:regulatory protein
MPTVTSVAPARGRSGFVNVAVDGVQLGCVRARDADSLGLQTGAQVDEAVAERIGALAGQSEALHVANRFIAFRPRSVSEVRQRLRREGLEESVVELALESLVAEGLLDDKRFADSWVENRTAFSPRSPRLLQMELRRKGIDRETAEQSLEDSGEPDETALAAEAGRRRLHHYRQTDRREFDRALGSFLARRGFSADATRGALETLWSERSENGPSL